MHCMCYQEVTSVILTAVHSVDTQKELMGYKPTKWATRYIHTIHRSGLLTMHCMYYQ